MPDLSLSEIQVSSSSYVDPNGFVFTYNDQIFRAIRPGPDKFYGSLFIIGVSDGLSGMLNLVVSELCK